MPIGKMVKHIEMVQHPKLRRYLPETHWLTRARTSQMLKSYSSIFIKPNHGSGGKGIIRVKKTRSGYQVRRGYKRKYVNSRSLYKAIIAYRKPSHQYLVQRGLQLARYKGSIFDIRIYMQKPKSKWVISGMVVRVAAPNRYVTNYHKGGRAKSLHKVFSKIFKNNRRKVDDSLYRITNLSYVIAKTLNKRHSEIHELGIDIAIDKNGRIWIIEANSKPGHQLFAKLLDKTMLHRIRKNKRLIRKRYAH